MASRRKERRSYTEENATRWLAWLARGMQKHGQTVFLIEQLQPSWLPTRTQRCIYVLKSRLIGGMLFALAGVCFLVFKELTSEEPHFFRGLLFALIFASIFALIDILRLELNLLWRGTSQNPARWQPAVTVLVIVLMVALFAVGSFERDPLGWSYALIGLTWGPVWASRSAHRCLVNDIQTVETTRWSWTGALKRGSLFVLGEVLLLIVCETLLIVLGRQNDAKTIFSLGLFFLAPFILLLGILTGGLKHSVTEMKTIPNQGIKLSIRTAAWSAGVGWLLCWLMTGLFPVLLGVGLIFGPFFGLFLALLNGGLDALQHRTLRRTLSRKGYLPRHLVTFLDYAANDLHFLQKVGGGYMFIHRSLLEYFAGLGEEEGERPPQNLPALSTGPTGGNSVAQIIS